VRFPALLGYGFRPFFLAAGIAAVVLVPWWALSLTGGVSLETPWPPALWHGHEMIFGFIGAAVAGFLLTAVPSWTGQRGFAGWPLALLAGLWLLGRLVVATSAQWPLLLTAAIDVAFFPALGIMLVPPLLRARNRNTPLLLVLLALCIANATFYWGLGTANPPLAHGALLAALNIILLLLTVMGGRIVPAFTSSALKAQRGGRLIRAWPAVNAVAIAAMVVVALVDLGFAQSKVAGVCALGAAIVQGFRFAQWGAWRTLRQPIVWVLHVAYAWLPVGLALKALALLTGGAFAAFWLHALTIGAATTMIFAVMTRASLGHTGRPLVVSGPTVSAYVLLTAAAIVRVLGPDLAHASYTSVITVAALLWTAAFALFLWVYAPMFLTPRADGKAG
jgi:uncharacterized protein involved in response to NO